MRSLSRDWSLVQNWKRLGPADETIEIFAFMEAADESKRLGGAPVSLATVLAKAASEAASKLAK